MEKTKLDLSGKQILVVEDDSTLQSTLRDILLHLKASVVTANNGLLAKQIVDARTSDFDLILTDIRMPEMDGIEFLKYCKTALKKSKFLLFTGFSEYLETKSAAELGADGFLAKPFRISEFTQLIESLLFPLIGNTNARSNDIETQQFCCISVDEFFSTTKLASDIYIKIGDARFVKLAHEESEIEISKLQKFKEHNVRYLFVRAEDFHKYTMLNLRIANALSKSDQVSEEKKLRLFKHTSEMLLQQVFVVGLDKSSCDAAYAMLGNTLRAIGQNDDLFEVLVTLQSKGDKIYTHSVGVSIYASLIANEIGWTSTVNQHKISLCGLFHDIGFKELPSELHDKPRFKMTEQEVKLYETHAARGRDILMSISGYPNELAIIAGQHHENSAGSGYPQHLSGIRMHPIAKLIRIADELVERTGATQHLTSDTLKLILLDIFENSREDFDQEILGGAFDLFKCVRPPGMKKKAA